MRKLLLFSFCLLFMSCSSKSTSQVEIISSENIYSNVEWLASDELQGRHYRSKEGRIAAKYIATKWSDAGLTPIPGKTSMYIPTDDMRESPNVAAMLKGNGKQFILLTAHYDHLKPKTTGKDKIYNGADDNASGTAALIAIAEALGKLQGTLDASIVVVAFTGEEDGLRGSKHFARSQVIPTYKIKALINLDMISRGEPNTIFIEGMPDAPRIALAISKANHEVGLSIIKNKHPDWMTRSDQWPFVELGVPAIFLSLEDHVDYHKTSDHAEKIMPELAAKTALLAYKAALDLAGHVPY